MKKNMKLVIDIPEEAYKGLKNFYKNKTGGFVVSEAIANGTPLPKEHGRLIDADALTEDLDFDVELYQRALDNLDIVGKERVRIQFDKDCKQNCIQYLSDAPTIIEADKEDNE